MKKEGYALIPVNKGIGKYNFWSEEETELVDFEVKLVTILAEHRYYKDDGLKITYGIKVGKKSLLVNKVFKSESKAEEFKNKLVVIHGVAYYKDSREKLKVYSY